MESPIRHVVLDTNVLSDFLYPERTAAVERATRSTTLLSAVLYANWPCIRIYTPAICIAESMAILDMYHFCTWAREVKANPAIRLSAEMYRKTKSALEIAVRQRKIEQLEHEPNHVLLAGLISPVNSSFQIRRKKRTIKPPMGAADCVIVGMAIHLVSRVGHGAVRLVTGDQRMADVVMRAGRVRSTTAEKLGLTASAEAAGLTWSPTLYPTPINLGQASLSGLRLAFGGWPLPTKPVTMKNRAELTENEKADLIAAWLAVARDARISNPDSLPYRPELEDIKVRFAVKSSTYLTNECIFRFLLKERKAGRLPRP